MKLLALDTSTEACTAALLNNGIIFERFELQPNQQSQRLLPMLESILSEAQMALSELDAIAFGCGPGSFTGLRIAASVTQGIALARDLPVIPVSSLQTMAQTAYREWGYKNVVAAVDAHVQAFYCGIFSWNEDKQYMEKQTDESLISNWTEPEGNWKYVGSGCKYLSQSLTPDTHINYYPKASAILDIAKKKIEKGEIVSAEEALPIYLYDWKSPA